MSAMTRLADRHRRRLAYRAAIERLDRADRAMADLHRERREARAAVRQLGRGL